MEFIYTENVRLYDTDAQGVVHYASYYRFFTDAIDEFRKKVLPGYSLTSDSTSFVTVESHAEYIKPARLDDVLTVKLIPKLVSKKALKFDMRIYKGSEIVCRGYIIQVAIDTRRWKSVEIPKSLLSKMQLE